MLFGDIHPVIVSLTVDLADDPRLTINCVLASTPPGNMWTFDSPCWCAIYSIYNAYFVRINYLSNISNTQPHTWMHTPCATTALRNPCVHRHSEAKSAQRVARECALSIPVVQPSAAIRECRHICVFQRDDGF